MSTDKLIEVPEFYRFMVNQNLMNRLVTNPNDTFGRKSLYVKYKFPLNPVSNFVELVKSLKKHIHKDEPCNYSRVNIKQFNSGRRQNDPKLPNCSKLDSVLEYIKRNNVTVRIEREHLVKRKYIKTKYYNQSVNISSPINIERLIPLLESMEKYQELINNSSYKQIGMTRHNHLKCVTHSIELTQQYVTADGNVDIEKQERAKQVGDILINSCRVIDEISKDREQSYNYLEINRSEQIPRDYRTTENISNYGYGIPNILDIITSSHFNIHVQKWVNELNSTSKFKKQFSLNSWIGDMYFVYARYVLSSREIDTIKLLCKT